MILVTLNKDRATQLVDCLLHGRPVDPAPDGWGAHDMLALAGACLAIARGIGPGAWLYGDDVEALHAEHREHVVDRLAKDLQAAICAYNGLVTALIAGKWDALYETDVLCKVSESADPEMDVHPVRGFKRPLGAEPAGGA